MIVPTVVLGRLPVGPLLALSDLVDRQLTRLAEFCQRIRNTVSCRDPNNGLHLAEVLELSESRDVQGEAAVAWRGGSRASQSLMHVIAVSAEDNRHRSC